MNKSRKLLDFILRRRSSYRAIFLAGGQLTVPAEEVLADLRQFCRATRTPAVVSPVTQTIDPVATGIAIGRLEVWHRIAQNLHLSDADLYRMVEKQPLGDNDE